jgi:hypothetical protein
MNRLKTALNDCFFCYTVWVIPWMNGATILGSLPVTIGNQFCSFRIYITQKMFGFLNLTILVAIVAKNQSVSTYVF